MHVIGFFEGSSIKQYCMPHSWPPDHLPWVCLNAKAKSLQHLYYDVARAASPEELWGKPIFRWVWLDVFGLRWSRWFWGSHRLTSSHGWLFRSQWKSCGGLQDGKQSLKREVQDLKQDDKNMLAQVDRCWYISLDKTNDKMINYTCRSLHVCMPQGFSTWSNPSGSIESLSD